MTVVGFVVAFDQFVAQTSRCTTCSTYATATHGLSTPRRRHVPHRIFCTREYPVLDHRSSTDVGNGSSE